MTFRPRPALAVALASVAGAAGVAPQPAVAQDEEDPVQHCYTQAITVEEADAGVTNEVFCSTDPEEGYAGRMAALAVVYDGYNGTGDNLVIYNSTCSGYAVNFGAGAYWNNRISSTVLLSCGYAKHWSGANLTGSNQLVSGAGVMTNMNATLNNQTSSIEYAP